MLGAVACLVIAALALRYVMPSGHCLLNDPNSCSTEPGPIGTATAVTFAVFAVLLVISGLRVGWGSRADHHTR